MKNLILILLIILVVIYVMQKKESYGMLDTSPNGRLSMLDTQGPQRLSWEQFSMLDNGQSGRLSMLDNQGPQRFSWEQFNMLDNGPNGRLSMLNNQGPQRMSWEQFNMLNNGPGSGKMGMLNSQGPEKLSWESFENLSTEQMPTIPEQMPTIPEQMPIPTMKMEDKIIMTLDDSINVLNMMAQKLDCNNQRELYNKLVIMRAYVSDMKDNIQSGIQATPELVERVKGMLIDIKSLADKSGEEIAQMVNNTMNRFNGMTAESFKLWSDVPVRSSMLDSQNSQILSWEQY